MSVLLVILMFALWSSIFALGKMALMYAPPVFLTGARMVIAGIILLGYLALTNRSAFKINKRQLFSLLILAVLSIYLTNICEFWGLQHLSVAKTCFIYSLTPFFAAFFSYLHFKEKMNRRKWIGMAIGFGGVLPIMMTQTGSEELFNAFSYISWPTLALVAATLFSVYGWIILRIVVKDNEVPPSMANGFAMLVGGTMAFIHSFFIDHWTPLPFPKEHLMPILQGLAAMTLVSNIICYNLYGMMLKKYTATFLSFVGLLSPIFASLHGYFFLGESLSWQIFLSTGVVSIGLFLVYQAELKQGYIAKKTPSTS